MPTGSTVVVTYDGTDITNHVVFSESSFEVLMSAQPGSFEIRCRDIDQELEFITGKQLTLDIDGVRLWGGYVTQVGRAYFFDYGNVQGDPTEFTEREWIVRGVDYNILLDKRVLRRPANYLKRIPKITSSITDGAILRDHLPGFLDVPDFIDTSTFVDDIRTFTSGYVWLQQGTKWRDTVNDFFSRTGALYYIDGAGSFHYQALDTTVKRWGFSDVPNYAGITSDPGYQDATVGMREITGTEDGASIFNDAFVWGGSPWAGDGGGTVFSRATNSTSISDHERWQIAETHFGEQGYGIQDGVDVRADLIVDGPPGADAAGQQRGLKYPQWKFQLAWFAHLVPTLSGEHDHIVPGELVQFTLETFATDGDPLVQLLPCRSIRISFPDLDENGNGYVRFDGFFGLQPDDPYTLWRYLLQHPADVEEATASASGITVDNDSTSAGAGDHYKDNPTPDPDGSTLVFNIPYQYVSGTTVVYLNGLAQRRGTDFTESDPSTGEITFTSAPVSTDVILVEATVG